MTEFEMLLDNADKENITVDETSHFSGTRIKGLYFDKHIAINKDIETEAEKKCILAEEIGHYHTAVGNIIDQSSTENRKQELHGRIWAYNKLIGLTGIINSYRSGCATLYDTAEYLDVTEEFLSEAINYYKSKYGIFTTLDNYVIYFEPSLGVFELI